VNEPFRLLDLFSGAAGGWSVGLGRVGFRTVAFAESDPWRRACFAAAHPGAIAFDDVRSVTASRLLAELGYLPEVVVGSPPCQDISAANPRGKGLGGDRSGLFWEWLRIVGEVRPRWACAENSPRARTQGIDHIIGGLEAQGYAVWPLVVGVDDAGAPHRRKRMWLIAADADRLGLRELPGRGERPGRGEEPAEPGDDDPDAHGRLAGRSGRHADGCERVGSRAHGEASADASGVGGGEGWDEPARQQGRPDGELECGSHAADRAGLSLGPCLGGDDGEELPPALRDIGRAWSHWNGGLQGLAASCAAAGFGRMDDGLPAGLAPGLRNQCISAYGDAVAPVIPEAIGRAILEAEGRVAA
jgi:DNA (cytosine-5)-methyltransferase 1